MRSPAVLAPRGRGEEVRRRLSDAGVLRTDLAIRREGDLLLLPVRADPRLPADIGPVEQREFEPVAAQGPGEYADLLDWSAVEKGRLPRSFDVVGDVVLVRVPDELSDRQHEIGDALLRFVPGARLVGADLGVHGPERRRRLVRIAGSGAWRTRHRENRLELDVDPERAYFSPRLAREHAIVADAVRPGETVYDLCCGVGPFAVTIARDGRARRVVAVDSNPDATALLRTTLGRYPFGTNVEVIDAPIERFLGEAPPADRVVFNLPREGAKYLPQVVAAVTPGGHLHDYEVVPRDDIPARERAMNESEGLGARVRVVDRHIVHPYSPSADLVAFDLVRLTE